MREEVLGRRAASHVAGLGQDGRERHRAADGEVLRSVAAPGELRLDGVLEPGDFPVEGLDLAGQDAYLRRQRRRRGRTGSG
jgi:hypothetical protein